MQPRDLFQLVGATIAEKFRVERVIGEGGFGVVYGGTHLSIGEPVAIKCMKPTGFTVDERAKAAESFLREARILFGLGHPAIVRLYDAGVLSRGEVPYVVLELLSGVTLAEEIQSRSAQKRHFSKDELISIFGPVFEAVAFAHGKGVVHRDLKPANMMLVRDGARVVPKVLDFGTARSNVAGTGRAAEGATATSAGFTPLYGAPEQWDEGYGRTGPHTDVFALGMTLFEACTLAYAFDTSGGLMAVFRALLDGKARPALESVRPDLPPELELVVHRALRPKAANRYADARELLASFRAAMKTSPTTAPLERPLGARISGAPTNPPLTPSLARSQVPPAQASEPVPSVSAPAMPLVEPSIVPWVIGAVGIAITIGAVLVGVYVATRAPAPADDAETTSDAGGGANAQAPPVASALAPAPTAVPVPSVSAVTSSSAPADASSPPPKMTMTSVTGAAPFWSSAEVQAVERAHHQDIVDCAAAARADDPRLAGGVYVIVQPDKTGRVKDVDCSMKGGGGESLCLCIEGEMSRWQYPPAHGRLGGLEAGTFIYEYRLVR